MKNKNLKLNSLKVKSFVTDFEKEQEQTVKGGGITANTCFEACNETYNFWCISNGHCGTNENACTQTK